MPLLLLLCSEKDFGEMVEVGGDGQQYGISRSPWFRHQAKPLGLCYRFFFISFGNNLFDHYAIDFHLFEKCGKIYGAFYLIEFGELCSQFILNLNNLSNAILDYWRGRYNLNGSLSIR